MRKFLLLLCLVSLFGGYLFADDISIFEKIVSQSQRLKSVEAYIVQYITENGKVERYEGHFVSDRAGRFRIDYSYPSNQIVVFNGRKLIWFFVDDGVVYQSRKIIVKDPKEQLTIAIDKRSEAQVHYLGRSWYGLFKFVLKYELILNHRITEFWIDKDRDVVLKKVIKLENGIEILSEEHRNFINVKHIFFPSEIIVRSRGLNGIIVNRTLYKRVVVNEDIDSKLFELKLPKGVVFRKLNHDK